MKIEHLILMKWNVTLYENTVIVPVEKREAWYAERKRLFEKYTLPSLRRQSCKNFKVFMFWDVKTPKEKILAYDGIVNMMASGGHMIQPESKALGMQYCGVDTTLITTRLDTDDSLHQWYVADVQAIVEQVQSHGKFAINFYRGYCYDDRTGQKMVFNDIANTFMSMVEYGRDIITVNGRLNTKIPHLIPTVQILKKIRWARIIHGGNWDNKMEGDPTDITFEKEFWA